MKSRSWISSSSLTNVSLVPLADNSSQVQALFLRRKMFVPGFLAEVLVFYRFFLFWWWRGDEGKILFKLPAEWAWGTKGANQIKRSLISVMLGFFGLPHLITSEVPVWEETWSFLGISEAGEEQTSGFQFILLCCQLLIRWSSQGSLQVLWLIGCGDHWGTLCGTRVPGDDQSWCSARKIKNGFGTMVLVPGFLKLLQCTERSIFAIILFAVAWMLLSL